MLFQCPDCGSGRRSDGYHRDGWYWLECDRRYNPETDTYSPQNNWCKLKQRDAEHETLNRATERLNEENKHLIDKTGILQDTNLLLMEALYATEKFGLIRGNEKLSSIEFDDMVELARAHLPAERYLEGAYADTLTGEVESLKEMLNELIDCHYGITVHHIGDGDGLSKEMTEKIKAHWQAHLGRKRE